MRLEQYLDGRRDEMGGGLVGCGFAISIRM